MGYYGYAPYVSVDQKRAKAQKWIKKQAKDGVKLNPIPPDLPLGTTWWGKVWNQNLSSYADYDNRLGRGRSYVKNGFIVDFSLEKGQIGALVMGSSGHPYRVSVKITPLSDAEKKEVEKLCGRRIDSLEALLSGAFPRDIGALFLDKLFPSPREIRFGCSCPDGAAMCKHIAAVLYAVSARLDSDPLLFFTLRGIDTANLLKKTLTARSAELLANARKKSDRMLPDADVHALFGV